ncbi:cytidylyltransferase domain-containing protein [Myroides sp. LJL110]
MLGIIIQARLGSTRLPKKILKPFADCNLLLFLIQRLSQLNLPIVVATTDTKQDDELCKYLEKNSIKYYRGSESDVLQRYIDTARANNFTDIIRVCSDSPLIDISLLKDLVIKWQETSVRDYLSFALNGTPTVLCHYGVFTEFTTLTALEKLSDQFDNQYYHEHVTYGIYKNPNLFKVELIELPSYFKDYDNIRITIDTQEDYENILFLYDNIKNLANMSFTELADIILSNKEVLSRMKLNIINNKKV